MNQRRGDGSRENGKGLEGEFKSPPRHVPEQTRGRPGHSCNGQIFDQNSEKEGEGF